MEDVLTVKVVKAFEHLEKVAPHLCLAKDLVLFFALANAPVKITSLGVLGDDVNALPFGECLAVSNNVGVKKEMQEANLINSFLPLALRKVLYIYL